MAVGPRSRALNASLGLDEQAIFPVDQNGLGLNQARFPIPAVLPKMHGAVRTLTALLQLKQLVSVRI